MKHIKKFNETKAEDKVEDQEVLFNAEVLVDKDEKSSFKTDVEDQEKLKKEFDKLIKVKSFESFIDVDIHIDNIDEVEIENNYDIEDEEVGCGCCDECTGQSDCDCCQDCTCGSEFQEFGCGCCDECTGQSDCDCCQDCTCGDEDGEVEQSNPETDVKVMNMMDFMNSISSQ